MRALSVTLTSLVLLTGLAATAAPEEAVAHPTPGVVCQAAGAGVPVLRIVPEPEQTNDYIGYDEWLTCLDLIEAAAPDFVEVRDIGDSAGWDGVTGPVVSDVLAVEVTNENSEVPFENRLKHVFQLSIHGNEKGGREGGFRVIEDLARCLDVPGAITADYPELCGYLDYMVAVFVFPNPDGWRHEEAEVYAQNPGTGFTRENANGYDLNRQWPNRGWTREQYQTLSQPEIQATADYLTSLQNIATATDIHGMLVPTDGDPGAIPGQVQNGEEIDGKGSLLEALLDAGQADPRKVLKTTRLAELLKERVNADPFFPEWTALPATGAWGGQVMEWGTSWDTIGYVDSGFTGDFFYQNHGLNATAMDFEMAYNHIVCDNVYTGCGMEMNRLHTRLVRQIVATFMESAVRDVQVSLETNGARTAWLDNPLVKTSHAGDQPALNLTGWAAENPADDAYDYANVPYQVTGNAYYEDLAPFVRNGDRPAVFDKVTAGELTAEVLDRYDNLVVAGSAYQTLASRPDATEVIGEWVAAGGHLVITDQALGLLADLGIVKASEVDVRTQYAGHTNFVDTQHELARGLRGLARQTYEPVPLGYAPGEAPTWGVLESAASGLEIVGTYQDLVNFGRTGHGDGTINFLGALLPDPTQENYHPYGLDSYTATYTGNQLLRNMLGWDEVYEEPPLVVEDLGKQTTLPSDDANATAAQQGEGGDSPGIGLAVLVSVGLILVAALRRD